MTSDPSLPGFDVSALRRHRRAALRAITSDDPVAFLVEPIQGEARRDRSTARVTSLLGSRAVQRKLNVLFVADEIQSGMGSYRQDLACRVGRRRSRHGI